MNIYFVGQKGIPANRGGVEKHVQELSIRLAEKNQNVFVYSRKGYTQSGASTYQGVHILYTPTVYTKHLEAAMHTAVSLLHLLFRRDVDVIHIHSIGPALFAPFAKLIHPRAKVVLTVHSPDYYHQKWNVLARFMLRLGERIGVQFADEVITVSKNLQQYLWHRYHLQAHYVPNGVPLPPDHISIEPLAQWELQPQGYIVAISRLVRHKGLHHLIEAYQQIQTDKKLVIVGGGEYTQAYVQELLGMAKNNPNIIFTGMQTGETLQSLFSHAYLFVQPSESEGLSIALLEALSHNQAVLASDIPENIEVLRELGVTFRQGDNKDLATKLQFLLDHTQVVHQHKKLGREHVAKEYNWEAITEKTIRIYATAKEKQHGLRKTSKAAA